MAKKYRLEATIEEGLGGGPVLWSRDTEERTVEMPAELADAFERNKDAERRYNGLSLTHRREYAEMRGRSEET